MKNPYGIYDSSSMSNNNSYAQEFNKLTIGKRTLSNDVTLEINNLIADITGRKTVSQDTVRQAISNKDTAKMKAISNSFFLSSGIYKRLCLYMSSLFRYDWFLIPIMLDDKIRENKDQKKTKKVIDDWYKGSQLLENSNLKQVFSDIALKVVKDGCYYGYSLVQPNQVCLQELPSDYCRVRSYWNGHPVVEFNVKYFNDAFRDTGYRLRVLKELWPKEIVQGYMLYQAGRLPKITPDDRDGGWMALDPKRGVKFSLNEYDAPYFISVIPHLLDLAEAQDLDKQKMFQQLYKILVQKMPVNKNGDLLFDPQESLELHRIAQNMLKDVIGVNVLTAFSDVDVADLSDKGNVSSVDQLNKVERSVYNESGVSQAQFNSDQNLALEKSIANDEATMSGLIKQFTRFMNNALDLVINKKPQQYYLRAEILPTTIYNYKDLSKQYKDLTTLGGSKLLPQVALGHSQLSVLMTAYFENGLMALNDVFVPPQLSSTMSGKDKDKEQSKGNKLPSQDKGGRPELPDDEKSDKTIQNRESEG